MAQLGKGGQVDGKRHGFLHIVRRGLGNPIGQPRRRQQTRPLPRQQRVTSKGQRRHPHPQGFTGCGATRVGEGVQNQVYFRVGGKGFVWSYPDREGGRRVIRTDVAVLYVGDEAEKQALLLGEPDIFFTAPGYDGWAVVMCRLEKVGVRRLRELVTDAWRMRAPELDAR